MSWLNEFFKNLTRNPFWFLSPQSISNSANQTNNDQFVGDVLKSAPENAIEAQGEIAKNGYSLTPEQEKYLDNLIGKQSTEANNSFQEHMRDTSTLSQGSQLEQLGLSASGVLQTGGASSGVVSNPADYSKVNVAMERYQQKMGIAKQLLGMTSQMASAGIYGHAIGAARKASSVLTSAASHSAYAAMQASADNSWNQALMNNPELREAWLARDDI